MHDACIVIAKIESGGSIWPDFGKLALKTLPDVGLYDSDIFISVQSSLFMEKSNSMPNFVDHSPVEYTARSKCDALGLVKSVNSPNKRSTSANGKFQYYCSSCIIANNCFFFFFQ